MKAVKVENNWKVLLIENNDLKVYTNRANQLLEETLRGYLFTEIVIPGNIWEAFEESALKSNIDRLLRIGMRVRPDAKYCKLEDSLLLKPIKASLKSNEFRELYL
jgi:hypothetical protein